MGAVFSPTCSGVSVSKLMASPQTSASLRWPGNRQFVHPFCRLRPRAAMHHKRVPHPQLPHRLRHNRHQVRRVDAHHLRPRARRIRQRPSTLNMVRTPSARRTGITAFIAGCSAGACRNAKRCARMRCRRVLRRQRHRNRPAPPAHPPSRTPTSPRGCRAWPPGAATPERSPPPPPPAPRPSKY